MIAFLEYTAKDLWELHGEELSEMRIVFPNKRSALYFIKYLKAHTPDLCISPECITINELFLSQSRKVVADKLTLCSKLYQSYRKLSDIEESFSDFYPFAQLLLGDFDAIDKHLVDTVQLFQNITSFKAIDSSFSFLTEEQLAAIKQFWQSFDVEKHSLQQQAFLKIWKVLPAVYDDFNETLTQESIAYEGRIFREVITALRNNESDLLEKSYVFIGFNVLSKAEEEMFYLLQKQGKALFYWDYDSYFVENKKNEAGRFIRKHIQNFPNRNKSIGAETRIDKNKEVQHIQCSSEVQQAKLLGQLLEDLPRGLHSKTAIVLANEELLPTVLSSLPQELDSVNISMGYPLKETLWVHWINLVTYLHKTTTWQGDFAYFSSEAVLKMLQHPYAQYLDIESVQYLQEEIQNNNKNIVAAHTISESLQKVFFPISNSEQNYPYLKELYALFFSKTEPHSSEREIMMSSNTIAKHINETLMAVSATKKLFFWDLLLTELSQQRMPFESSKEDSLQIIGFLETRLLDFESIYILSANEAYLPNIQLAGSLIPYNLRIGAGLPTLDEQNSMYAYYFYRLLSRVKHCTLFSVSGTQDMTCKEQSRYITQLKYEAPFQIKDWVASAKMQWVKPSPVVITKGEKVQAVFQNYFHGKRKLSASAINKYLRCPQSFYYQYIKGVDEVKSIAKADDSNMFGSIFHKAAELLYQPYIGEEINQELLKKVGAKHNIEQVILEAFKTELFANEDRKLRGKELLIFDTLVYYLKQLLLHDKAYCPFTIVNLELELMTPLAIEVAGEEQTIVLKGLIDRVDTKDGIVRVVDYKTGTVTRAFLDMESLFTPCDIKNRNSTALQTFLYSWLYYKNKGVMPTPSVYEVKQLHQRVANEFVIGEPRKRVPFVFAENVEEYEAYLRLLLGEIFGNVDVFYPTPEEKDCTHDAHTGICTLFEGI